VGKLQSKFQYQGRWWLPSEPDNHIEGTLYFSPDDGALLELSGSFNGDGIDLLQPEVIFGITNNGTKITLGNTIQTEISHGALVSSKFIANYVFEGGFIESLSGKQFTAVMAKYTHLDEWVCSNGFEIDLPVGEKEIRYQIRYKKPKIRKIYDCNDFSIFIDYSVKFPKLQVIQTSVSASHEAHIKIVPTDSKSISEVAKLVWSLEGFLSLAVIEPVFVTELAVKTAHGWASVYYQSMFSPIASKRVRPVEMLFTYPRVKGRIHTLLRNWFDKGDRLSPCTNLYFSTIKNESLYLENEFLNLVQALESYHRRFKKNTTTDPATHRKKVAKILDSIPKREKDWLAPRLQYSNEPSLAARLRDIMKTYSEVTSVAISDPRFVRRVTDTRNYLTHYSENLATRAAKGDSLFKLAQGIRLLFELCLLAEIGFRKPELIKLITENRRYRRKYDLV